MKLNKRERERLMKHLIRADGWMRELHGWLWNRRRDSNERKLLIRDIKRGERVQKWIGYHE